MSWHPTPSGQLGKCDFTPLINSLLSFPPPGICSRNNSSVRDRQLVPDQSGASPIVSLFERLKPERGDRQTLRAIRSGQEPPPERWRQQELLSRRQWLPRFRGAVHLLQRPRGIWRLRPSFPTNQRYKNLTQRRKGAKNYDKDELNGRQWRHFLSA